MSSRMAGACILSSRVAERCYEERAHEKGKAFVSYVTQSVRQADGGSYASKPT